MENNYHSYREWKANLFALHFCVPIFMWQKFPIHHLDPHQKGRINFKKSKAELFNRAIIIHYFFQIFKSMDFALHTIQSGSALRLFVRVHKVASSILSNSLRLDSLV